jgi:ADP-ribose pyrophosphatase
MEFKTLDSNTVFQGRVFNVRQDRVRLPNDREVTLDIVAHNDAVTIVPIGADGKIWMIRQYRHAAGKVILELPAGLAETGEAPQVSAARELREEIGLSAGKLELLGSFYLAPGYSSEYMHVFLGKDLRPDPLPKDEDEFIDIVPVEIEEAYDLARKGNIQDAKTLAALLLARPYFD